MSFSSPNKKSYFYLEIKLINFKLLLLSNHKSLKINEDLLRNNKFETKVLNDYIKQNNITNEDIFKIMEEKYFSINNFIYIEDKTTIPNFSNTMS